MKTKQLFLNGIILMIAACLFQSTSCRKPDNDPPDTDTNGAQDNALADQSFEDIGQISNEAASSGGVNSYKLAGYDGLLSHCATVTRDTVNKKITVDFGSTNCYCHDNRWRRGKLFISYTPGYHGFGYWDSLSNITITTNPDNSYFFGNDQNAMHQVIGTKSITNNGRNSAEHLNWDIHVDGEIIKANNQGKVKWKSARNREWIAGYDTPFIWSNDVYGITGWAEGTSPNGTLFSVTITNQLIRKMAIACRRHFVEGTFDFTPGSKPVRHVDFGYSPAPNPSGSCDSWISITINGNIYYKQLQ